MIKLCIFDMDGLLIDSERYMWNISMDIACKEQGFEITDEFHAKLMGLNKAYTSAKLQEHFGPTFDVDRFYERVAIENDRIMQNGIPLMKGTLQLLDYLDSVGIKKFIGTSSNRSRAERVLKIDGIYDRFDGMVCGDEISKGKPDPEIYLRCFNNFNFDKSEALVFEDAEVGGRAAIAAGIRLVLVPDLAYLSDDIKDKAYKVISDLSQIIDIIKKENETTTSI